MFINTILGHSTALQVVLLIIVYNLVFATFCADSPKTVSPFLLLSRFSESLCVAPVHIQCAWRIYLKSWNTLILCRNIFQVIIYNVSDFRSPVVCYSFVFYFWNVYCWGRRKWEVTWAIVEISNIIEMKLTFRRKSLVLFINFGASSC